MPEGHSIHRLARQLTDVFAGQRVAVSSPQGRFAAGAALLDGHVLTRAEAIGKQLLIHFENHGGGGSSRDGASLENHGGGGPGRESGDDGNRPGREGDENGEHRVLRIHLGLYGAFSFGGDASFRGASSIGAPRRIGETESGAEPDGEYAGPPAPVGAVRVRLVSEHGWADLRGPSACEVLTSDDARALRAAAGPDPLRSGAAAADDAGGAAAADDAGGAPTAAAADDAGEFTGRLRRRNVACGQLLMDQSVVAGIGNVYRAELLFRAGIDPYRPGKRVTEQEAADLWADAVFLMRDGVRLGRIVTTQRDPAHAVAVRDLTLDVDAADIPEEHGRFVYQRTGQPCPRCGTPVASAVMAGRNLYWCPGCQH